jgi:hypothetical protein
VWHWIVALVVVGATAVPVYLHFGPVMIRLM